MAEHTNYITKEIGVSAKFEKTLNLGKNFNRDLTGIKIVNHNTFEALVNGFRNVAVAAGSRDLFPLCTSPTCCNRLPWNPEQNEVATDRNSWNSISLRQNAIF